MCCTRSKARRVSSMVWGCFSSAGVGQLVKINCTLKKEQYKEIFEQYVMPPGLELIGSRLHFQLVNDPKHSLKLCREYLQDKETLEILTNIKWPAQSPDLNLIALKSWAEKSVTIVPNIKI